MTDGSKAPLNWKAWLVRCAWCAATLVVSALSFPLLLLSLINPTAFAVFVILALGYVALLWSMERARFKRMDLPNASFMTEMGIHALVFLVGFLATAVLSFQGLLSAIGRSIV